ncbi:MAG: 1-deoxy-D-xylulose-5-phosphate synthase [Selenomonadales bacterium]|nr:1-deoxy-D-xylulose-5-phosphate synthase [Selenomonadales bacterium]
MSGMLDTLVSPNQIKKMSYKEIARLADEIRQLLIETVSHTGGHLAPNLGVVELTLAIHRVFDTPKDKIVFDVGHQSYVHKILTGRADRFHTLRTKDGISGFPKIHESEHDSFGTGHSSTSISAALGMALARDMNGEDHQVLAVIGDGSMTGGQAFEALNHAGNTDAHMIVILNDNEMSIDKNVGALSEYLSKARVAPSYNKIKQDAETFLKQIPAVGDKAFKTVKKMKDGLSYLLVSPGMLFEELGFHYYGPIDGHNTELLTEMLTKAKHREGPVLVHVVTKKGKGYRPAEEHADTFHGVGPFCVETGKVHKKPSPPSYTSVFGNTLISLAEKDPDILGITAAMPEGTGLKKFGQRFPKQFFDVGIAEQHAVTLAAGLAAAGKKPVVALYSTFAQRAYDQILHDVCLQNLPVVFAIDRAGLVGEDGPTHHGVFDLSYLRLIPNIVIMAPKDENELRHMLASAVKYPHPVALRYPRGSGLGVETDDPLRILPIGKGEVIREGKDAAFLAIGSMVHSCTKAAEILAEQGIDAEVINLRFAKPLDKELILETAKKHRYLITAEDNALQGGVGSAITEMLDEAGLYDVKVLRLGIPDRFIEHGNRAILLRELAIDEVGIAEQTKLFVEKDGVR